MREPTPEQLERLSQKLQAMIAAGVKGKARELSEIIEAGCLDRCAICGWPLAESAEKGCVRGNCSMRSKGFEAWSPQMRIRRENIEKRLEWLEPWVVQVYLSALFSILKEVEANGKHDPPR